MALLSHPDPRPSRRLTDALQLIQDDYNRVLAERDSLRHELVYCQTIANEQESELSTIRRTIWNLQNQLQSFQQNYEDERRKLFDELRQQRAAAGLPPPLPLRDLPATLAIVANPDDVPQQRERDVIITTRDRKMKGRAREYPDIDRDEYREPKRMRQSDIPRVPSLPVPPTSAPPPHSHQQPVVLNSYPVINGATNGPSPSSQRSSVPPHTSTTAAPPMSDDLTLMNVPPEYRKELNNWSVSFNPKLPRNMDVHMVFSIPHPSVVCSIQFSSDGRYVATGCNQAAYIYDIKTGTQVCALVDPSVPRDSDLYIRSVRFSPDGEYLATGAEDQQVRVWNIKQRTLHHVFAGHTNEIYALDYAQNGNFVVSGSADRTARLWDLRTPNNNNKVFKYDSPAQDCGITSISISPNNRYVAGGCLDGFIRIWNVENAEMIVKLRGHADSVYAVRFTPNGQMLLSGSLDYTVKYWDMSSLLHTHSRDNPAPSTTTLVSCPLINSLKGHQDYVLAVACSSDNRYFVSGAKDRALVLWDPAEGIARFKLHGHKNSVISVDIHGSYIATASGDMCCRIWAFSVGGN